MEKFFKFSERGTDLRTEILAGVTTFLTMAYIVFVNPGILSAAGVPFEGAATATALGAALMCVAMGFISNRPLALASGMGLNAVVTFSIIGFQQANVPWQVGMAVIFVEGLLILLLVLSGLREAIMNAIPLDLKRAIGVGIGLFITVIGLVEGGIIQPNAATVVSLGDFTKPYVWVTLIGLFAILAFMALKVKGDILWGILVATVAALALGVTALPKDGIVSSPDFTTFLAPFHQVEGGMALMQIFTPALLFAVFAVMLSDFFDTMGTVISVGEQAGFTDENGQVPGVRNILLVDSAAAATGGLFGASSITTYIESAAGVAEGGRTGVTPIVTGVLFAAAAFFAPIVKMVGGGLPIPNAERFASFQGAVAQEIVTGANFTSFPITAGALIIVGFLMMRTVSEIPWDDLEEAFPAFLTIVGIPLTYNISWGIGLGFISYVLIKLFHNKAKDIHPLMWVASIAFLMAFLQAPLLKLISG